MALSIIIVAVAFGLGGYYVGWQLGNAAGLAAAPAAVAPATIIPVDGAAESEGEQAIIPGLNQPLTTDPGLPPSPGPAEQFPR